MARIRQGRLEALVTQARQSSHLPSHQAVKTRD